jgi:hypothetical protein
MHEQKTKNKIEIKRGLPEIVSLRIVKKKRAFIKLLKITVEGYHTSTTDSVSLPYKQHVTPITFS